MFRIKPYSRQSHSEGLKKSRVHQDPGTPQRLRQNCVRVSPEEVRVVGGLPQGQALCAADGISPLGEGHHEPHHRPVRTYTGLGTMDYGWRFMTLYRKQGARSLPRKKKCKKEKSLSEEALQIAVKRREAKSKGEKERHTHLNAEFQRIARRDKKAFLSDQCKEIEENNRMGKTRDLFKKIRDTKGTFQAKMGLIKDRNGMDLTEEEGIKKRWQEYTELYKKNLHDPDNHDGVITCLEPDILECEVKWTLGSITMNKATRGDGIRVELFQILKDDAVKVSHSIS